MSRARKISTDLRHVATLAGTTAAVVEGAAIAAEKAKSVTDHLSADHGADSGPTVDVAEVAKCRGKKKLFVLLLILVLGGIGVVIWKKRSAQDENVADLRDEARFAGSMP
ncbi:MAG TPA: hypothetical protein PLS63_01840 [Microthrixaceae bacterium]|nr:hypothetical protein [Microthrixaceae bacterium]